MTRSLRAAAPLLLTLASCTSMPGAEPPQEALRKHEITIRYGRAHLDDDWRPFDKASGGGLEYSFGLPRSPWRFFGGVSRISDDAGIQQPFTDGNGAFKFNADVRFRAQIREIYGGARHEWTWAKGWIKPYLGAGVSYTQGLVESFPPPDNVEMTAAATTLSPDKVDQSDESFGMFTQAGMAFPIGDGFRLSLDWRWLFLPEFDLLGETRNGGYQMFGFGFGWRF